MNHKFSTFKMETGRWNMKIRYYFFFLIPGFYFSLPVFSQNIYDTEHSLLYARHLFSIEKYELAAKEYERLLFFNPGNDSLTFLLSRAYIHSRDFNKALNLLEPLVKALSSKDIIHSYMNLLLLTGQFEKAQNLSSQFLPEEQKILSARTSLLIGDWKKTIDTETEFNTEREKNLFSETRQFSNKKPAIALGLSIIPGLGKVYTRNYSDAAMSFLTIGISAVLSYRGYVKKGFNSTPGWIYGGLCAGFYLGNFYGGFKSAKVYNKNFHENSVNELKEIIVLEN